MLRIKNKGHLLSVEITNVSKTTFLYLIMTSKCSRGDLQSDAEAALNFLANHCKWAVVTLGPRGCIAKHGKEVSDLYKCLILSMPCHRTLESLFTIA